MVACFFAGWKTRDIAGRAPEPIRISGSVIDVEEDLYTLSVGSDDAVRVGAVFSVSRGETKLGEIVITKTLPDSCIGRVKQPTWTETLFAPSASAVIQSGDIVTTDISPSQLDEIIRSPDGLRGMMNP